MKTHGRRSSPVLPTAFAQFFKVAINGDRKIEAEVIKYLSVAIKVTEDIKKQEKQTTSYEIQLRAFFLHKFSQGSVCVCG